MARDIQARAREALDSDTARAVAATAVGEAIRRVGATRNQAAERVPNPRVFVAGSFAAGAGAATVAQVAARRLAKLITGRRRTAVVSQPAAKVASGARKTAQAPRDAVDAFTSKVGSSGGRRSTSARRSKPTSKTSSASGTRTTKAKTTRSSNGTGKASNAKSSRSSNGSRAKSTSRKSPARPAASRRS